MVCTWFAFFEVLSKLVLGEDIVVKRSPVFKTELFGGVIGVMLLDFFAPIVRFFDDLKLNGGFRVANAIQFDFYEEKADVLVRMAVTLGLAAALVGKSGDKT